MVPKRLLISTTGQRSHSRTAIGSGIVTLEIGVFGWLRQSCLGNGPVVVTMLATMATKAVLTSEMPEPV
jgi:hypothetical protein